MNDTLFLAKQEVSHYDSSMISLLRQFKVNSRLMVRQNALDEASRLRETLSYFRTEGRGENPKELEYGSQA